MADDSVTLALDGEISLRDFGIAVQSLQELVQALGVEVARGVSIAWFVEHLDSSSAIVTVRAESDDDRAVREVTQEYLAVGRALEAGEAPHYSFDVVRPALEIAGLINGAIGFARFETAEAEAIVRASVAPSEPADRTAGLRLIAFGAVEGVVQTLSSRKGLRFTLFDSVHDKAVSCYLHEDQEELMRDAWGRRALVEGSVSREPETGRPLSVRQISHVEIIPDYPAGSYRAARAVSPRRPGDPAPEEAIRQVRDAE